MSFTFYPTFAVEHLRASTIDFLPDVPFLLPASSWARIGLATPVLPEHLKARTTDKAADCGGFVATRVWGDYRYSPDEYVNWLLRWGPTWAATMDYCCESPITGGRQEVVYRRQERTTTMAYHFWKTYRDVPWCWVPTIQGWEPEDYRKHARELRDLLQEMHTFYGPTSEWRVGVGTLCARADVETINAVLSAVREELPIVPLHLWGVKLAALKSIDLDNVVSSDSGGWHEMFGSGYRRVMQEARACGLTRTQYTLQVKLPAYIQKVNVAVARVDPATVDLKVAQAVVKAQGWTWRIRPRGTTSYVYARRRMQGKTVDCCLGPVTTVACLSSEEICSKLGGKDAGPRSCPSLWDREVQA